MNVLNVVVVEPMSNTAFKIEMSRTIQEIFRSQTPVKSRSHGDFAGLRFRQTPSSSGRPASSQIRRYNGGRNLVRVWRASKGLWLGTASAGRTSINTGAPFEHSTGDVEQVG